MADENTTAAPAAATRRKNAAGRRNAKATTGATTGRGRRAGAASTRRAASVPTASLGGASQLADAGMTGGNVQATMLANLGHYINGIAPTLRSLGVSRQDAQAFATKTLAASW